MFPQLPQNKVCVGHRPAEVAIVPSRWSRPNPSVIGVPHRRSQIRETGIRHPLTYRCQPAMNTGFSLARSSHTMAESGGRMPRALDVLWTIRPANWRRAAVFGRLASPRVLRSDMSSSLPTSEAANVSPMTETRDAVRRLGSHYRSGTNDLGKEFFVPCLTACQRYRRAVGYFSSSSLVTWSAALPLLVQSYCDTTIQLLISPALSAEDSETLRSVATPADRQQVLQTLADQIVEDALALAEGGNDQHERRHRLLAWMLASGRLEIQFAFPRHVEESGLFHEKIGIFDFPWGDTLAFTGSANETRAGHQSNYESIDVFRSWVEPDLARVRVKEEQFDEAWSGQAHGLEVVTLSEQALQRIRVRAEEFDGTTTRTGDASPESRRWRHQDEAIQCFLKAERGVLEMATGTGKTRTALRICESLLTDKTIDSIIVSADGNDLLDQWYLQLLPLAAMSSWSLRVTRHYGNYHEREFFMLDPTRSILLASRYALPPALRKLSPSQAHRAILIHDEVHRLGSPANREKLAGLADHIRFRLGLSATPEREYDQEGTAFIDQHVGPVCYRFGLADAIKRNILSPFNYFPLEYKPDENDRERIRQVYKRAAAKKHAGQPMSKEEIWTELSRVHKTSLAKLPVFELFIKQHQDLLKRCIVFVETQEYGESVLRIVHRIRHDFHTYFSGEESGVLRRFAQGDLECLLTCHRLSEGIDIQDLRTVILFSSARTRLETIQRMGRCLRVNPEDPSKIANVIDFIRIADIGGAPDDDNADQSRRDWLNELALVRPEEEDSSQ